MEKEEAFFQALRDVFIGADVQGQSGFVNLMRVKSRYYEKGVFPRLKADIESALKPFPNFRDELFERLYTFFRRYFSESGSIYFRFTPPHEHVYEKVYTDDRDVALFWKTHMLYYVKTDRLFQNMQVEVAGFRFFFDVSTLEHKRANEKRALVYTFKERRDDGTLVFTVAYSEKGKKTKVGDIRKAIKGALGLKKYTPQVPTEETLERAFRLFERQSEVDFFINKDARRFLREQFSLWLYQYVFEPEERKGTVWTEQRIQQLQVLKEIAYKIIDFIAQFEHELVRIWNKPKFVLESHYVITLDRIATQKGGTAVLERLLAHPGMEAQVQEWRELGMVGDDFARERIWVEDDEAKHLHERYQYLPIDTKHFPDLEMAMLSLFDHLDQALDGWLVHSENYQALKTMLPKFRARVKCIYIDPPYNTGSDGFIYEDQYQHSTWLAMMADRLALGKGYLLQDGIIFVSIDDREVDRLRLLMGLLFSENNKIAQVNVKVKDAAGVGQQSIVFDICEYGLIYANSIESARTYFSKRAPVELKEITGPLRGYRHWVVSYGKRELVKEIERPGVGKIKIFKHVDYDIRNADKLDWQTYLSQIDHIYADYNPSGGMIVAIRDELPEGGLCSIEYVPLRGRSAGHVTSTYFLNQRILARASDVLVAQNDRVYRRFVLTNLWEVPNASLHAEGGVGLTSGKKPERLLSRIISSFCDDTGMVLDFFVGSGTSVAVAHKTGRRWIAIEVDSDIVEMAFERMKRVVSGERSGISREVKWQGGGFFKYCRLEHYEEVLRKARYRDDDPLFVQADPYTQYVFLRDPKMLDNAETGERVMEVDTEKGEIRVDLSKLYPDIDLAETLSCLTGKWIRRIYPAENDPTAPGTVEFEDGTTVDLQNPLWDLVKPLIWW